MAYSRRQVVSLYERLWKRYFHIFNLFPKQVIIGSFILVYKELVYGKSFLRQALIGKSQPNGIAQRWQKF